MFKGELISDYITLKDEEIFCCDCCEVCSYQCVVWRKALMERDKELERKKNANSTEVLER